MKQNLTELVFILDKSGSMTGLEKDTIGGFNSMLEKQKKVDGGCRVTTVLFDNRYELLHDRIDLQAVQPLTDKDYEPGGSTALLDAIGRTIHKIGAVQRHTAGAYRASHVLFVIITDGEENSSREYTGRKIKEMIERQKSEYGWEFVFLGANIDAVAEADSLGISKDNAVKYRNSASGVRSNYEAVVEFTQEAMAPSEDGVAGSSGNWKKKIEKDED